MMKMNYKNFISEFSIDFKINSFPCFSNDGQEMNIINHEK